MLVSGPALLGNVVLFGLLVYNLVFGVWSGKDGHQLNSSLKGQMSANLKAVIKLFFALGLPWICDVIAWLLLWNLGRNSSGQYNISVYSLAAFLKVFNSLQVKY